MSILDEIWFNPEKERQKEEERQKEIRVGITAHAKFNPKDEEIEVGDCACTYRK